MKKFLFAASIIAMLLLAACNGQKTATPTAEQPQETAPAVQETAQVPVQTFETSQAVCRVVGLLEVPQTTGFAPISESDYVNGNPEAPVTILEYSELQCPYCAQFEPVINDFLKTYPDTAKVVFLHFPLTSIHDKALLAARALEAAGLQDKKFFSDLKTLVFSKQSDWAALSEAEFEQWLVDQAGTIGFDAEQFKKDLQDPALEAKVLASMEEARQAGVGYTPYVVINGFIYEGERTVEAIKSMSDALVALQEEMGAEAFAQLPSMVVSTPDSLSLAVQTYKDLQTQYGEEFIASVPRQLFMYTPENVVEIVGLYNDLSVNLGDRIYSECPPTVIDPAKSYSATLETTKGNVVMDLYADKAPVTVNSFVFLANEGWFNDIPFHRVIEGFVAQSGDPSGLGLGGPGYQFSNEISDLGFDKAGVVGMANAGPESNGSQFFITFGPVDQLTGSYTVFGQVTEGMDILNSLNKIDPANNDPIENADRIVKVTIAEK